MTRREDLKTLAIHLAKTPLFATDPFRISGDFNLVIHWSPSKRYIPVNSPGCSAARHVSDRYSLASALSPVRTKNTRPSGVKITYPAGYFPLGGSFWPVA
jgi:hypothetical protein